MPAPCQVRSHLLCIQPTTEEDFPSMRKLETSTLHRGVAGARHAFLPVPPGSNKLDLLLQVCVPGTQRGVAIVASSSANWY